MDAQNGVRSFSEDPSNPAVNFVVPNRGWCSAKDSINVSGQYVEITFDEPIVAVILISGGKLSSFVNNFTLGYTEQLTGNNFHTYGVLKPVQVKKYFVTT